MSNLKFRKLLSQVFLVAHQWKQADKRTMKGFAFDYLKVCLPNDMLIDFFEGFRSLFKKDSVYFTTFP